MLRIWIRQEGVSETEALKISLSKDSHISDLIVLAAPLFRFHKDLRASELQLVKCDEGRTILSNRHLLCELDEEDVIIRPKDSSAQVVLGKFKTKFVSETAHPAERKNEGKEIAADSKTVLLKKQLTPQVEGKLEVTTKKHVKQASATEPNPSSSSAQGAGKNQRGASNTHTHPQKNPVRYEPSETSKCESVTQSVVNSLSALSMATADERTSKEAVKHPKHIKKESQRRSTTSIKTDVPTDMKVEVEFHTDPGNVPQTDKKVNPDLQTASHRSLNNMKNSDKSTPKSNEKEIATSRVVCDSFSPRWGLPAACRICGHMKPMHVPTKSSGGKESKLETKDMPVHQPIDSEASDSTLQPDPDTSRRSKICRTRRNLKSDAHATAFLDGAIITKRVDSNLVSSDTAPEHPREKSPYASPYPPDFSPHREDDAEEENEFMFSECADVCDTRTRSVVSQLNENQKSHSDSEPTRPGGNNTSSKKKKKHKRKK